MSQAELFSIETGARMFRWQWHGRQAFRELRNDFNRSRTMHTVVEHFTDTTKAPTEAAALEAFATGHPGAQTISCFCVGPVKKEP
jgi:hypothetical protein